MNRYLVEFIIKDLNSKAVLLSGPRQVGKTTLANSIFGSAESEYLNYDVIKDRKIIHEQSWRRDVPIVILDEVHKFKKWKNFLKGIIDKEKNNPPLIITGSARLEFFRKAGDALTGRTFAYHLHPIDVAEACKFQPDKSAEDHLSHILKYGGFPESFFNPQNAKRLLNDRISTILRDDVQDLSRVTQVKTLELLVELLRDRVSGQLNFANLSKDLSVSPPTIKSWVDLLEKLYLIFIIRPFASNSTKSIRKEPKFYFFDNTAVNNAESGADIENIAALALLKWCELERDTKGRPLELKYYRDSNNREVDFVITEGRKILACIEVKSSDNNLSPALSYLTERVSPKHSFQLVHKIEREKVYGNIKIKSLSAWLKNIATELD